MAIHTRVRITFRPWLFRSISFRLKNV